MPLTSLSATPVEHGPISCLSCFSAGSVAGCTVEKDGWRIDNNPGYWGAAEPEILVLGFSKGANQRLGLPFDGMLDAGSDIDVCFTAAETKLGFASVIRCGLGLETEPGEYATSGKVVRAAIASDSPVRRLFDNCTEAS
jgi:hypothetical protein